MLLAGALEEFTKSVETTQAMTVSTYYTLDARNRILDAGGGWDTFAEDNEAAPAKRSSIVGHELWKFVDGVDTQSFLNAVFFVCRREMAEFSTKYRCDSPTVRRLFEMHVSPGADGEITVRHALLEETRGLRTDDSANMVSTHSTSRCSLCCRFRVGDTWVDPFCAPDQAFFPESYTLCSDCRRKLRQTLDHVVHTDTPPMTPTAHS